MSRLSPYKRGWQKISVESKAYKLFEEVYSYAVKHGYFPKNVDKPELYQVKSTRFLGKCIYKKYDQTYYVSIILNPIIFQFADEKLLNVIIHEVAHACTPGCHHNYDWYTLANSLGSHWNMAISRLESDEEICAAMLTAGTMTNPYKYELYCPTCGTSWKYKRNCEAVKHPDIYKCTKDGTHLCSRAI